MTHEAEDFSEREALCENLMFRFDESVVFITCAFWATNFNKFREDYLVNLIKCQLN